MKDKKIRTEGGHFWLTFDNGYTLSCFNGYGSHTENNFAFDKWHKVYESGNVYENYWESDLVEIAIISPNGDLTTQSIIKSDDSVKTVDINELVEIINIVSKLEKIGDE